MNAPLNAENALKATHNEIRTQRNRIAELMGDIRDLEQQWSTEDVQRISTENTTLKQRVRQISQDNRTLEERLQAARSNLRVQDRKPLSPKRSSLNHPTTSSSPEDHSPSQVGSRRSPTLATETSASANHHLLAGLIGGDAYLPRREARMTIQGIRAVVRLARSVLPCPVSGLWHAVRFYVAGRSAVKFERERRTTLCTVSAVLPPGTEVYDSRADGSVLRVWVAPITHNDITTGRNSESSNFQAVLPPAGTVRRDCDHTHLSMAEPGEE